MSAVSGIKISGMDEYPDDIDGSQLIEISVPINVDPYFATFRIPLTAILSYVSGDVGALNEVGSWDAKDNVPTLTGGGSGMSTGDFRVVSVATLEGYPRFGYDWAIGDWIVWNGTKYRKVDNKNILAAANKWTKQNDFTSATASVLVKDPSTALNPVNKQYFEAIADSTSNTVAFARPTVHAASYSATTGRPVGITGNILASYTGAIPGVIQTIYHTDATPPTFPTGWKLVNGFYSTGALNMIHCEFVRTGSTSKFVNYWITQVPA
jgi:hypothetical protein